MSTRSIIAARVRENGAVTEKIVATYCHFDGYPDGVGLTLWENYRDYDRAFVLANEHEFSSLAHSGNVERSGGIADGFNRGRHFYPRSGNVDDLPRIAGDGWADYLYVHNGTEWMVSKPYGGKTARLADVIQLVTSGFRWV